MQNSGLVLVTGPTGAGKTTTLNYMVDLINATKRKKIIMVEDPVEFEHKNRKSIVVQIEVGTDTYSFTNFLKHILRLDPDVICIGELRNLESIETALTAAETGHLVFATLHTPSSVGTLERIVSAFDGSRQPQVILQLASVLRGIVAQKLIPTIEKNKCLPAFEILLPSKAIKHLIRENELHKIRNTMLVGKQKGTQLLENSLADLYRKGLITLDNALLNANEPGEIESLVKMR